MKKFLFFAASAIALFASCQKTEINYQNGPQEIALFAVNKTATKAPVVGDDYLISDDMQVTAYLAKVDDATAGLDDKPIGYYFTDVTFANPDKDESSPVVTNWKGGWYWPLTDATVNFVAVTSIGGGVALNTTTDKVAYDVDNHKFTVTLDNNTAATYNQTDLMYAINEKTKTAGSDVGAVPMVFKHALSWVKFAFKTNVADVVTIKSVELYADYNGVVDVLTTNFTEATSIPTVASNWTDVAEPFIIKVPNAVNSATMSDMVLTNTTQFYAYGNGLLVVPTQAETLSTTKPYFILTYAIKQNGADVVYKYKYMITTDFVEATMYTYNINITLDEIEVAPTVTPWDEETATEVELG